MISFVLSSDADLPSSWEYLISGFTFGLFIFLFEFDKALSIWEEVRSFYCFGIESKISFLVNCVLNYAGN